MARWVNKRWLLSALVASFVVGVGALYLQASRAKALTDPASARRDGRPIPVRTTHVEEAQVDQVVGATALTIPSFTAIIRIPPTGGLAVRYVPAVTDVVIKTIYVDEGDYVKKGQPLFEFDSSFFKLVLEQRKTALAAAEAQLERAKQAIAYNLKVRTNELTSAESEVEFRTHDLEGRKKEFDMMAGLRQGTNAASLPEYYDAKSKNDQARFDLDEARRRLEWAQDSIKIGPVQDREELTKAVKEVDWARIDLEETQRGVDQCKITSPIDGFVDGKVDVVPGQTVAVTSPLARVIQLDPLYVRLDFPQERLGDVAVGQAVDVNLDSFPGETFHGTVLRSSAQVNPQLRVFPVVVTLSNPGNRIRAGISGFARVHVSKKSRTVPSTAVIEHDGKAMVFRVEEGRAHIQEVHTGPALDGGLVEVTDGLGAGDEVVVYFSNFYRHWGEVSRLDAYLQDNDLVDTDWRKWARRD